MTAGDRYSSSGVNAIIVVTQLLSPRNAILAVGEEEIAMKNSNADDRDGREGRYTQVEPERAAKRTVHGQYTETDAHVGPDSRIEGQYVGSVTGQNREPMIGDTGARHGNYPEADHSHAANTSRPWSHFA